MEILNKKPLIIIDGAHNPKSFKYLFDNLINDFKYDKLFLIVGVLKDKNIKLMIPPMILNSDYVITTQSKNNRALSSIELKKMIKKEASGLRIINKRDVNIAIKHALSLIRENDLLCISGSLYTISEAREYIKKNRKILTLNN
jgi:dihydrofolate synthase/folylpolyglutamate synthase